MSNFELNDPFSTEGRWKSSW